MSAFGAATTGSQFGHGHADHGGLSPFQTARAAVAGIDPVTAKSSAYSSVDSSIVNTSSARLDAP